MAGGKIEALVTEISAKTAECLGYELVDVVYAKEGGNWILRIFIDKEGGISTDDCEKMSRAIEKILDEKDPIEHSYSLEVSSPGLDRPLKKDEDYIRFKGRAVDIKLYKSKNGAKKYNGELLGLENGVVSIEDEKGNKLSFDKSEIASIRLAIVF